MNNKEIIEIALLRLYEESIKRIKSGIYFDKNLKTYDIIFIKKMVSYFETIERYEDCQFLINVINQRFDHQNNYLIKYE
jgi:hypothetical protein